MTRVCHCGHWRPAHRAKSCRGTWVDGQPCRCRGWKRAGQPKAALAAKTARRRASEAKLCQEDP
jgi:hypothetical protein